MEEIANLISNFGFPTACVISLGLFIYKIYLAGEEEKKQILAAGEEREERLYNELKSNREINSRAIETLALTVDRLDGIEKDVGDIRNDLLIIKEKIR